jgi:hypothetical protein
MSREQDRIITDQQQALRKAHQALSLQKQQIHDMAAMFAGALSEFCMQIENGRPQCAADRMRQLQAQIQKEIHIDSNH